MRKIVRGFVASFTLGFEGYGRQWPIWYRMKETEQTIILKRAVSNVIYHAFHKFLVVIISSMLLILSFVFRRQIELGILQWVAFVLLAWNVIRLVGLFRFRIVFQKDRKIMIKREYRTIKFIVNGYPFKVTLGADKMVGFYDGVPLFAMDCESDEYKVLLEFFKSVNTPIDR